ncbi:transcription initiation factor IIB family protein (plasmid) [Haloferax mediterranei ATCC 33500]|uniref:Transcription initiation factor IIB family protein n=1 Tax=Haloferax mediterranei (strain ATCC 33500 / DSM 1411 / JCM 8866 / NBRC 14739 / NCIMB 2177 / R-4) TaxID=523841 RepID=A0A4V1F473_HALMT|nr:transcription initiation factor IIB family protein [Haloferax mediterranei]MDX5989663.1 transcription initiation factor IIB family protein [Haloferax mediterranei ATCC 33500]QCQ77437.1 transcription initiation factor IIB family protein [Haloferax mediterranei ATCC 33500]
MRRRDQACQYVRSAQDAGLFPGRAHEAVAAASVYAVCRCTGLSRTLDEFAPVARVPQSQIISAYKALNTELGLPTQPITPAAFVPRVANALDVTDSIRRRARTLAIDTSEEWAHSGATPKAVAAACVYTVARDADGQLTQARVATVSGISVKTIQTHHQTLRRYRDETASPNAH